MKVKGSGRRLLGRAALVVVVVGVVGGGGFWAGREALVEPGNPLSSPAPVTYTVGEGTVGRSLTFTAAASWDLTPLARNPAAGVVTSMPVASGEVVAAGQVLYSVGLRPVVAVEGTVPAFRGLAVGTDGPDVAQLQRLLISEGFLSGAADGMFGPSTRRAVQAWQRSLGEEADGAVRLGDVVFFAALPVRVAFASDVEVGAPLSGGEEVVLAVPEDPTFRISVSVEQQRSVPLSARVRVFYRDGAWEAQVARVVESPRAGEVDLVLGGVDGAAVCGGDCTRWVDLSKTTEFRAEVVVIPETSGPVVPVAAIETDAGNHPFVTTTDGGRVPVTVVVASQGLAVVEGVDVGAVLRLPSADSSELAGSG